MKFREERPFADVDAAVKKLLELANGMAADHAGRLSGFSTLSSRMPAAVIRNTAPW
jgi:hypothetical protein